MLTATREIAARNGGTDAAAEAEKKRSMKTLDESRERGGIEEPVRRRLSCMSVIEATDREVGNAIQGVSLLTQWRIFLGITHDRAWAFQRALDVELLIDDGTTHTVSLSGNVGQVFLGLATSFRVSDAALGRFDDRRQGMPSDSTSM